MFYLDPWEGQLSGRRKKGKSEISQFLIHILIFMFLKSRRLKSVAYVASEGNMKNDRILAQIPAGKSLRR